VLKVYALPKATMNESIAPNYLRSQPTDVIVAVGSGDAMKEFECYKVALAHAAEYFDVMLSAGMVEDETSRIEFPDKDPETWVEFYKLIDPLQVRRAEKEKVTGENVCKLLPWFHEFGMKEYLKASEKAITKYFPENDFSAFWKRNSDQEQSRLERRKNMFSKILDFFEISMKYNLSSAAQYCDTTLVALVTNTKHTIDLFTPEVIKRLVPFMIAPDKSEPSYLSKDDLVNEITGGHIPLGGYSIRCYFDNLLRKEITGDPVNEWNVSEEALEASGGWCISRELATNELFPLLVHSYLQRSALSVNQSSTGIGRPWD
jgi:hypothetical protein